MKAVRQLAAAAKGDGDAFCAAAPGTAEAVSSERGSPCMSLVEGFVDWGVHYLLDNLARALHNEAFAPLVEQLQVRSGGGGARPCGCSLELYSCSFRVLVLLRRTAAFNFCSVGPPPPVLSPCDELGICVDRYTSYPQSHERPPWSPRHKHRHKPQHTSLAAAAALLHLCTVCARKKKVVLKAKRVRTSRTNTRRSSDRVENTLACCLPLFILVSLYAMI